MLKLEMSTWNLDVRFECKDEEGDHLAVLTMLKNLIEELDNHHDNVNLTIVSRPTKEDHEEFPVREE